MNDLQKNTTTIPVALWVAQALLAAMLVWAGVMKLSQSPAQLSAMWPWTGQVPAAAVKITGIIDLAGAMGLILPALLRIKPRLTPMAAIGIMMLMLCAAIFHIVRGEASSIGINLFVLFIAAFIAWGRLKRAPISAR